MDTGQQPKPGDWHPFTAPDAAMRWIAKNGKDYAGQWVALDGGRLLASGQNGAEVANAARARGVKKPAMIRIPVGQELPFAGW